MYSALKYIQEHPSCYLSEVRTSEPPKKNPQPILNYLNKRATNEKFGGSKMKNILPSHCCETDLMIVSKIHPASPSWIVSHLF